MSQPFYTVDVFTNKLFSGAQIAVFPHAETLSDHTMLSIAQELNLTETVFILPQRDPCEDYYLRIFSPREELAFAGHPILAAAKVLVHLKKLQPMDLTRELVFGLNSQPATIQIRAQGDDQIIQFSLKVAPIVERFVPERHELADLLSVPQAHLDVRDYDARLVACDRPYLIVPIRDHHSLREAQFDFRAWAQSSAPSTLAQEILLFSPKSSHPQANFAARLLGPNISQLEDPPIGSALPAFAAYLADRKQVSMGTHAFSVIRGQAPKRESLIQVELDKAPQRELEVRLGGTAVLVSEGKMYIPDQAHAAA